MASIKTDFGSGGAGLTPGGASGTPDLATALRDMADDLATVKAQLNTWRTAYLALLAKLDLDAGVTDTNYAASAAAPPAAVGALKTLKV